MQTKDNAYDFLVAGGSIPRGNVTRHVTDLLRNAIVTLKMKPGETIDKNAICARLSVSRFPVSDALSKLQDEGLVEILPQRGTRVSLIRMADVREYMLIRKAIEAEAVRALVNENTPEITNLLEESLEQQRQAAEGDDQLRFHLEDCEFHEILFAAMRFNRIKTIVDSVRANVDRARRLITKPRRLAPTIEEHEAIVRAVIAGDADQAANAMRNHIDAVMNEIQAFAQQEPKHFADGNDFADSAAE